MGSLDLQDLKLSRGKGSQQALAFAHCRQCKKNEKCYGTDDHTPHQGMGAKPEVSLPRAQNGINIAYCSNGQESSLSRWQSWVRIPGR